MKSNKSTNAGNGNRPISRLPSGYGSIRYLGSGRSRPYAVHPPAVKKENTYIRPDAICYVSNWFAGFAVLTAFHAGVYEEGMEEEIDRMAGLVKANLKMAIEDYITQETPKFITGARSLDEFEAYQNELKGLGIERYIEIYSEAYAPFMNSTFGE